MVTLLLTVSHVRANFEAVIVARDRLGERRQLGEVPHLWHVGYGTAFTRVVSGVALRGSASSCGTLTERCPSEMWDGLEATRHSTRYRSGGHLAVAAA